MASETTSLMQYRDLLWNLVARDLKIRYRGSVLGFLWTILNPLFMAAIYIIFLRLLAGRGARINNEEIIIGVFAWQFTVQCVNAGMCSITGNTCLVKKVYFPRLILPLSTTLSNLVNFYLTVVVQWGLIIALLGLRHESMALTFLWTPIFALYHLGFNLGLSLLVASVNVFYRDTQYVVNLLLSAWFFLTPVMYPLSMIHDALKTHPWLESLYMANPLSVIIVAYRAQHLATVTFPWSIGAWIGLALPVLILVAAWALFQRTERHFSDIL